jgi:2-polyprenyl-3-methyl-5-hydroxy-6-metoxy-1,4-benzoquinol methylase
VSLPAAGAEKRAPAFGASLDARARQSLGSSDEAIYRMVARVLEARGISGGTLVDVGCGGGGLWRALAGRFSRYRGLDAVRYESFPGGEEFHEIDLDAPRWPIPDASGDVVAALETIEHLENPWAFMRRLRGLARPGGWVIVTTPNQTSALSLLTLVVKHRFSAFQDAHYPAHRTALLECDLERAARDAGLEPVEIAYTCCGRLPFSGSHYPRRLAALFPRALSDNLMLLARRGDD